MGGGVVGVGGQTLHRRGIIIHGKGETMNRQRASHRPARLVGVAVGLGTATLLAACGSPGTATSSAQGSPSSSAPTQATSSAPSPATTATTGPAPTSEPASPPADNDGRSGSGASLADATTDAKSGESSGQGRALLTEVRTGDHQGYDRLVFEFRNHVPGWEVAYTDPPIQAQGTGANVSVAGQAYVSVRMQPASGVEFTDSGLNVVYDGPDRLSGPDGQSVLAEAVSTGDFEALLTWATGLRQRTPFRVNTLTGPPRLVIDFAD
jgi:hypothetical protein